MRPKNVIYADILSTLEEMGKVYEDTAKIITTQADGVKLMCSAILDKNIVSAFKWFEVRVTAQQELDVLQAREGELLAKIKRLLLEYMNAAEPHRRPRSDDSVH